MRTGKVDRHAHHPTSNVEAENITRIPHILKINLAQNCIWFILFLKQLFLFLVMLMQSFSTKQINPQIQSSEYKRLQCFDALAIVTAAGNKSQTFIFGKPGQTPDHLPG